jgi:hypothetical protein
MRANAAIWLCPLTIVKHTTETNANLLSVETGVCQFAFYRGAQELLRWCSGSRSMERRTMPKPLKVSRELHFLVVCQIIHVFLPKYPR